MHLVSEVIFDYSIRETDSMFARGDKFKTLQELQKAIKDADTQKPLTVHITRTVKIMDTDDVIAEHLNPAWPLPLDKYRTVKFDGEHFIFIVADKLIYPYEVRNLLKQEYGDVLDLENKRLNDDVPVLYSGVTEHRQYGLKDEQGRPTIQTLRYVNCRNLTDKDIVLDKNFCPVWPIKSKKPSLALERFLHRTKEIVHQK
ncbi:MAG: hypothetical protein J6S74_03390 [Alphaproteobacteria bacterium]|nr:hypothetical protein [Alphaproteobacteria bacterium]